jgi:hypothetical protein
VEVLRKNKMTILNSIKNKGLIVLLSGGLAFGVSGCKDKPRNAEEIAVTNSFKATENCPVSAGDEFVVYTRDNEGWKINGRQELKNDITNGQIISVVSHLPIPKLKENPKYEVLILTY